MKKVLSILLMLSGIISSQSAWQSLEPPGGGNVTEIYCIDDSVFLAGVKPGLIFRTNNAGDSWEQVIDTYPENEWGSSSFFMGNDNGDVLTSLQDGGLFLSTDKGVSWQNVSSIVSEEHLKINNGYLFLAEVYSPGNIFCSRDGGYNWFEVNRPADGSRIQIAGYDLSLYTLHHDSLRVTSDHGDTWRSICPVPYPETESLYDFLVVSDNLFFISTSQNIYRTSDSGVSWNVVSSGLPIDELVAAKLKFHSGTLYTYGAKGIFYSDDYGETWNVFSENHEYNISSLGFSSNKIYCGEDTGFYEITPDSWISKNDGITSRGPKSLYYSEEGFLIMNSAIGVLKYDIYNDVWEHIELPESRLGVIDIAVQGDKLIAENFANEIYFSSDSGNEWSQTGAFDTYINMEFSSDNSKVFMAPFAGGANIVSVGFFESDNYGGSWNLIDMLSISDNARYTNFVNLGNDSFVSRIYEFWQLGDIGVYYYNTSSSDGWVDINDGLTADDSYFFVGDEHSNAYTFNSDGLFSYSYKYGRWWNISSQFEHATFLGLSSKNCPALVNDGELYYMDETENWNLLSEEIDTPIVYFVFDQDDNIYMTDTRGNVYKNDLPISFDPVPQIPVLKIPENDAYLNYNQLVLVWEQSTPLVSEYLIQVSESESFEEFEEIPVFVDTTDTLASYLEGTYFWRVRYVNFADTSDFSEVRSFTVIPPLGVEQPTGEDIVYSFKLEQNYPNPFNPSTKISYSLDRPGETMLKIYNSIGELVLYENLGIKEQGEYSYNFNGELFPSGVYFYELAHSNGGNVRNIFNKMVLVK